MSEQTDLSVILDGIEARANASMSGPWFTERLGDHLYIGNKSRQSCGLWHIIYVRELEGLTPEAGQAIIADADFIAASRTDVPALVKALREAPCTCYNPDGSWPHDPNNHGCYRNAAAAILQASSEPKEKENALEEPGDVAANTRDVQMAREMISDIAAALTWLDDFVEEPETFPSEGDYQWWREHRDQIRGYAKKLRLSLEETKFSSATSVSSERKEGDAICHIQPAAHAMRVEPQDSSSAAPVVQPDSAAAVSEEEKWTERDVKRLGRKPYTYPIYRDRNIAIAHNASLERHAKRVKQELGK